MLRLPQGAETPLTAAAWAGNRYSYAYARATQSRALDDQGQDYLVVRQNGRSFAFALCDGVSQSYFGGVAARFLGDDLVDWIWGEEATEAGKFGAALNTHLRDLGHVADSELPSVGGDIRETTLMRAALDEARSGGSESMFVCGRIELPSAELRPGQVLLAWMGDSRVRLWGSDGEIPVATPTTAERWSTKLGPIGGEPHVLLLPILQDGRSRISRLLSYSDGLARLDHITDLSESDIEKLVRETSDDPDSDDISLIDVNLEFRPHLRAQSVDLPTPVARPAAAVVERRIPVALVVLVVMLIGALLTGLALAPVESAPGLHLRERVGWLLSGGQTNSMAQAGVTPTPRGR